MKKSKRKKGPQFLDYVKPIVEVLKNNGGSGAASEIIDKVIDNLGVSEIEVADLLPSGESRVRNRIQWARFYLSKAGMIESPRRGLWQLTQEGYTTELSEDSIYILFTEVHKQFSAQKGGDGNKLINNEVIEDDVVEDEEHSVPLIRILKELTAGGFEKICKRLLTEVGLHDIVVTGRSGDQGIDGYGLIKINDVVNFNIVFQCKRYKDTVSSHHVRDFRGAMQGRAEKGLIITTGRFTAEAKREANRDGVPPIELIDGEKLVTLFEKYELGLKPVIVFQIVPEFFNNYK